MPHRAFTNTMTVSQIVVRRRSEDRTELKHSSFDHGTALTMYIQVKDGDPEYPLRSLTVCQDHDVFSIQDKCSGFLGELRGLHPISAEVLGVDRQFHSVIIDP